MFTNSLNVVVVDDDSLIRNSLKILIANTSVNSNLNIRLYSSADGIDGLGLIYVTNPDLIIIDSTLPKYSGREIVDYLISSEKFVNKTIIVLNDDVNRINLPPNYKVINKKSGDFLAELNLQILEFLQRSQTGNILPPHGIKTRLLQNLVKMLIRFANQGDVTMYRISASKNLLIKVPLYIYWILIQLSSSILYSLVLLTSSKVNDANVKQGKEDLKEFRVKTYPTLVTLFVALIFLIVQLFIFIAGGIIVFGNVGFRSVFADISSSYSVVLNDAVYDSAQIEISNGMVRLKELTVETPRTEIQPEEGQQPMEERVDQPITETPIQKEETQEVVETDLVTPTDNESTESSQENSTSEESQDGSVQGVATEVDETSPLSVSRYSNSHPSIVFNQKISFDTLLNIYEESSINVSRQESIPDINILEGKRKLLTNSEIQTRVLPANSITYQLSPDRLNWFYYGSELSWEKTTNNYVSSNTIQEINQFIQEYSVNVGGSDLYIKAFLHSDGSTQIELKDLTINREIAFISTTEPVNLLDNEVIEDSIFIPSYPVEIPISFPTETAGTNLLESLPVPSIFTASFVNGNKVVAGKILDANISDEELAKFSVKVYYTNDTDIERPAVDKGAFIESVTLARNVRGEITFYIETPGSKGGFVVAELVYTPAPGKEFVSGLSKPLES